jgi:hypothetical protein
MAFWIPRTHTYYLRPQFSAKQQRKLKRKNLGELLELLISQSNQKPGERKMSRIPYSISTYLSVELHWPKEFYKAAFEVLTHYNALQFALFIKADKDDTSQKTLNITYEKIYFVFKHVIYRTL